MNLYAEIPAQPDNDKTLVLALSDDGMVDVTIRADGEMGEASMVVDLDDLQSAVAALIAGKP